MACHTAPARSSHTAELAGAQPFLLWPDLASSEDLLRSPREQLPAHLYLWHLLTAQYTRYSMAGLLAVRVTLLAHSVTLCLADTKAQN